MANMSYCRFRNTLSDLRDCANHLYEDDLGEEEKRARDRLIRVCREIIEEAEFNGDAAVRP